MYFDFFYSYLIHVFAKWTKCSNFTIIKISEPVGILQIGDSLSRQLFSVYCINKSLLPVFSEF